MADTDMATPEVGDRFTYDGVEYVVNRLTPRTHGKAQKPAGLQVDCMAVVEVERRRNNLQALLDGEPAGDED